MSYDYSNKSFVGLGTLEKPHITQHKLHVTLKFFLEFNFVFLFCDIMVFFFFFFSLSIFVFVILFYLTMWWLLTLLKGAYNHSPHYSVTNFVDISCFILFSLTMHVVCIVYVEELTLVACVLGENCNYISLYLTLWKDNYLN